MPQIKACLILKLGADAQKRSKHLDVSLKTYSIKVKHLYHVKIYSLTSE